MGKEEFLSQAVWIMALLLLQLPCKPLHDADLTKVGTWTPEVGWDTLHGCGGNKSADEYCLLLFSESDGHQLRFSFLTASVTVLRTVLFSFTFAVLPVPLSL